MPWVLVLAILQCLHQACSAADYLLYLHKYSCRFLDLTVAILQWYCHCSNAYSMCVASLTLGRDRKARAGAGGGGGGGG